MQAQIEQKEKRKHDRGNELLSACPQHGFAGANNTGTFVKRDNKWQAVAWQATKIPAEQNPEKIAADFEC